MNEQHVSPTPSIAVVGAGPRGTSLLERIGAHLSADLDDQAPDRGFAAGLHIHVIDDAPHGPGRIWRTDQPRDLCMNTLAHAVTLFTEPGATITGPVREGPTLYEWAVLVREVGAVGASSAADAAAPAPPGAFNKICASFSVLEGSISGTTRAYFSGSVPTGIPVTHIDEFLAHPVRAGLAEDYAEELAAMRPESHPSRALYGEYLAWCFDRALALLPAWVRVTKHRARVTDIARITSFTGGIGDTSSIGALGDIGHTGHTGHTGSLGDLGVPHEGSSTQREQLTLDDGSTVIADAVILATGWLPVAETRAERALSDQMCAQSAENKPSAESEPNAGGFSSARGTPTVGTAPSSDTNLAAHPSAPIWVRPASPIEQDLSSITAGERVIMRGLGMSFFDTLSLLTLGRGGQFVEDQDAPGGLRYIASGAEPTVHVTSRRGVPFRSKSLYGGLPPRPSQRFLRSVDWAHEPRPINFDRRLWPRIVADAFLDHATTLERVRPGAVVAQVSGVSSQSSQQAAAARNTLGAAAIAPAGALSALETALEQAVLAREDECSGEPGERGTDGTDSSDVGLDTATIAAASTATATASLLATIEHMAQVVEPFIADEALRFDLAGEAAPVHEQFASPGEFEAWVRARVAHDLHEAELGVDSPLKAGLWSISAARAVASRIGSLGGFDAESRASGFKLLFDIGGMVGSGPPAFRNRQLLALSAAGLVRFVGPAATVEVATETVLGTAGARAGAGASTSTSTSTSTRTMTAENDSPTTRVAAALFTAESPLVAGSLVEATALVDAWMHFHSLDQSADPVALGLLHAGRARSFHVKSRTVDAAAPGSVSTGGFDIDPASGRIVHTDGTLDAAVHVAGIPADQTLHDTVISPMPGTDPPLLRETDRVARSAIRIARHSPTKLPLAAPREGVLHA